MKQTQLNMRYLMLALCAGALLAVPGAAADDPECPKTNMSESQGSTGANPSFEPFGVSISVHTGGQNDGATIGASPECVIQTVLDYIDDP